MAIDFPASPTTGQTFTSGSVTYTWDGVKWTAVAAGGGATDKITEGNTSAEVIDTGSDGRFVVTTEGVEALRVDPSQRLLVGTSSARSNVTIGSTSTTQPVQIESNTNTWSNGLGLINYSGSGYAPVIALGLSFTDTKGANALTSAGEITGRIAFLGNDGTNFLPTARIESLVDGTPGTNDMPGRLVFSTTADGASSPTERMRITNKGQIYQYTNINNWALQTQNQGNSSANYGISIWCGTDAATGTNYAVEIADGDGGAQGYITFTGGTVTYGTFTAYHPCILPEADKNSGYPYGTLLETTSIEYTQKDGHDTERGILYNVRKTQATNSRAVLGAYGSSMNGGPGGETNRHQALVLGDGHILCNNSGGNIKVGDGICSSATPGIGQKATATPSMIIGIAQEEVTFADDEEVKLVAVQYGVRQFIPWGD